MNSTSSQPNFLYAIVIKEINQKGKKVMKSLLVVNPSSGGEQAKEFEQLAIANWNRCLMKWSSCIQKQGMQNFTREAATEGYHSVLSWAEMEQSTKESVESLNKNIGQISDFPIGYGE